jgi:hypothetical protein
MSVVKPIKLVSGKNVESSATDDIRFNKGNFALVEQGWTTYTPTYDINGLLASYTLLNAVSGFTKTVTVNRTGALIDAVVSVYNGRTCTLAITRDINGNITSSTKVYS